MTLPSASLTASSAAAAVVRHTPMTMVTATSCFTFPMIPPAKGTLHLPDCSNVGHQKQCYPAAAPPEGPTPPSGVLNSGCLPYWEWDHRRTGDHASVQQQRR